MNHDFTEGGLSEEDDDDRDPSFEPDLKRQKTIHVAQHYRKRPRPESSATTPSFTLSTPALAPLPSSSSSSSSSSAQNLPVPDVKLDELRKECECVVCHDIFFNPYHCSTRQKSHSICKICLDQLPEPKSCPICRIQGPWFVATFQHKFVECFFPKDFQRRDAADWLRTSFPEIVPLIKKRFDPNFQVLSTTGDYGWAVRHMIEVLQKEDENKELQTSRTDRFWKAVFDNMKPPHRHFFVFIGQMSCCNKGHSGQGGAANHNISLEKHFRTPIFAVKLRGQLWQIVEAPIIVDDD